MPLKYTVTGTPLSELQKQSKTGLDNVYDIKQFALVAQDRSLLHSELEKITNNDETRL